MSAPWRGRRAGGTARVPAAALLATGLAGALAGCGSPAHAEPSPLPEVTQAGAPFLASSLVTAAGTWAVAVMGGSAASHNNFWQLFIRPTGSDSWHLVTPPGVPDNGGLVVAGAGGKSLIGAVRPSQYLTFTPLAVTHQAGGAWSPTGPLNAALANVPDAMSVVPGTGRLLALLTDGSADQASPGYVTWHRLVSQVALAATAAGQRCGIQRMTGAAYSPAGMPMLAASCARPGVAGIFTLRHGNWQAAGPPVGGDQVTVLRLSSTGRSTSALLRTGAGAGSSLLAAWSADGGGHWALSRPLPARPVSAASLTPQKTIVLDGSSAMAVTAGDAAAWHPLPRLPAGTATVAPGPVGGYDALAVHGARLTVWRLAPGAAAWQAAQAIKVPVRYGSSS